MRLFLFRVSGLFLLTALALFATHARAASNFLIPTSAGGPVMPAPSPLMSCGVSCTGNNLNTYSWPNSLQGYVVNSLNTLSGSAAALFYLAGFPTAKQDIKYLLRSWLRAIGQPLDEINDWLIRGVKLGEKSKGAVNVTKPNKRWSANENTSSTWQANKLAAYMTKYIAKEFDTVEKGAKKYWHSKGIEKPEVIEFWLGATNFPDAIKEAYEKLFYAGVTSYDTLHSCEEFGIVWLTASTSRDRIGKSSTEFVNLSDD